MAITGSDGTQAQCDAYAKAQCDPDVTNDAVEEPVESFTEDPLTNRIGVTMLVFLVAAAIYAAIKEQQSPPAVYSAPATALTTPPPK